ncbi:hypothetical protein DFQ27_005058, partial [Actinomortierella ambigua]
ALDENIKVFQVDEFRTSCRCNRCGGETKATRRSLMCLDPACGGPRSAEENKRLGLEATKGLMLDRDHNGSSNMNRAVLSQLTTFTWPRHLDRTKAHEQEADASELLRVSV